MRAAASSTLRQLASSSRRCLQGRAAMRTQRRMPGATPAATPAAAAAAGGAAPEADARQQHLDFQAGYFDREAPAIRASITPAVEAKLARVAAAVPGLSAESRVLDAGAGEGALISHLQASWLFGTGSPRLRGALAAAERRARLQPARHTPGPCRAAMLAAQPSPISIACRRAGCAISWPWTSRQACWRRCARAWAAPPAAWATSRGCAAGWATSRRCRPSRCARWLAGWLWVGWLLGGAGWLLALLLQLLQMVLHSHASHPTGRLPAALAPPPTHPSSHIPLRRAPSMPRSSTLCGATWLTNGRPCCAPASSYAPAGGRAAARRAQAAGGLCC